MKNLYRANMQRIVKNKFFILGCVLAFVVTLGFTANLLGLKGTFECIGAERRMFFISVAMLGFFTIFVPIFTNTEYRDGVIRNKIASGYTQKEVYFCHLFAHITALALMMVCYFIAGLAGGAKLSLNLISSNVILFLAICGYISLLMIFAMRIQKMVILSVCAFVILEVSYSGVMIGNALLAFAFEGTQRYIASIVYNMAAIGQWMTHTGFTDDFANPGNAVQVVISVAIVLVTVFLGTIGLDKRDLK